MSAQRNQAGRQLYIRFLDRLTVEPLPGTDGAYQPFFSPDGKWLAFFTGIGELKKLSLDGGPPVTLVRGLLNGQWGFGAWRTDDLIVFSAFENLMQVPAEGGTPKAVTTVDAARNESFHQFPQVVPSTGDVLFTVGENDGESRLDLVRWDTKERSRFEGTTESRGVRAPAVQPRRRVDGGLVRRHASDGRIGRATA
jgi:Tol biopolymer transport system component